jgi:hypothetical protein
MKLKQELLGESLHTALRKACDSHPTSAAWNCINAMKATPWKQFLEHVVEQFKDFDTPPASTKPYHINPAWGEKLRKSALSWEPYGEGSEAMTLFCIFECFEKHDWQGFASWLPECEEREKAA